MRYLLAATCLTPVALAVATPVQAQTVIGTARTTPVRTSTVKAGTADHVRISSAGSVKVTAGAAVTIDSNNNVTNEGTVQITGANDSTGIVAEPGRSATITNSGTILLDEAYTPVDSDKDGDNDGLFATGQRRYGIRVAPGGTFTGSITNSGTIGIEGNNSAAISVESDLAGSLSSTGKIELIGNDSTGIRAGDVSGNVTVRGSINVRGANGVAMRLDGDVGGAVTVQGTVMSTGYRSSAAPADTSKLDADDLLQGGPALSLAGSVAGGLLFDAAPSDTNAQDNDEDDDGIADASEGTAAVSSFGAAPAVRLGAAGDISIGAVANQGGFGIVNKGTISGSGVYRDISATGVSIGGLGGAVTVAGGLDNRGRIEAQAVNAGATALRVGAGATLPQIRNSSIINARGGGSASVVAAISIDAGANVGTLRNSGSIMASTNDTGTAAAILDQAGTLTLVENSGAISASSASSDSDRAAALDLRASGGGVTVRQLAVAQNATAPRINGNILLGSGSDLLDVADGTVTGTTRFGAGADRLNLSGDAVYNGSVDFGTGAGTLVLGGTSAFRGTLSGENIAVTVNGGSLDLANSGTVALSSLTLGAQGSMTVNLDPAGGTGTLYQVAGEASFAQGARVIVNLSSVAESEGSFTIVDAGTLTGGANLTATAPAMPFLYVSGLSADQAAGEVALTIRRKTANELGLNGSESRAYTAAYAALAHDEAIGDAFLAIADGEQFRSTFRQMLPNHAGGLFETVTQGSRAAARFLGDPRAPAVDMGGWGFFLQQVGWGTSKDLGDTAAYDISGWGASGGAEVKAGDAGAFGLALSYLLGKDADGSTDNEVRSAQFEVGGYWRGNWGGFSAFARASGAFVGFDGMRRFTGAGVTRQSSGEWNGMLLSGGIGAAYEMRAGRLSLRPAASLDHYRLSEDGYRETGGGAGFDLLVEDRDSKETAANGSLSLGYDLAGVKADESFFRVELEGGRREILSGSIGDTIARFEGGEQFTLVADERRSGWTGKLRLLGGTNAFRVSGEVGAEEQLGQAAVAARLSLHSAF